MENLPVYIPLVFSLNIGLVLWFFYQATHHSRFALMLVLLWLALQSLLAWSGFYTVADTLPPRFLALILPPLLLMIGLFFSQRGRHFIAGLDPKWLTILHIVRVPVELVLYWLFLHKTVPELMTFEGRNYDILPGLTAPLLYYFAYIKKQLDQRSIFAWHVISLGFLLNIVFHGILSAPTPFQQFAFEQPNIALMYFPYALLPGLIVPMVLFAHLALIWKLVSNRRKAYVKRQLPV